MLSFSINARKFWSLIHQSTFPSFDIHVMNGQHTVRISTVPESQNHPILRLLFLPFFSSVRNKYPLWSVLLLGDILFFRWGCQSFHFLIYIINLTSSHTLTYSSLYLLTTASFHLPIYNINVNFLLLSYFLISYTSIMLTFFSSFLISVLIFSLHLCIPISSSPLLLVSLFCGMLLLNFELEVWLVAQLFRVLLFTKHIFSREGLDTPYFISFLDFFPLFRSSISDALCFLNWYFMIISIKRHPSCKYNPSRRLNISSMKSNNIWLRFIASSFRIWMSYLSQLRAILYCSNNSSLFSILIHGKLISNRFLYFKDEGK